MKLMAQVSRQIGWLEFNWEKYGATQQNFNANIEICRLANAAGRSSQTYQRGLLTLQRLRTGGTQTVNVTHQQVSVECGQAAVAGKSVQKGGGRKRARKK
jgi:hypothetical protein